MTFMSATEHRVRQVFCSEPAADNSVQLCAEGDVEYTLKGGEKVTCTWCDVFLLNSEREIIRATYVDLSELEK